MPLVNYDLERTWRWLYRRQLAFGHYAQTGHPLYNEWVYYGRDYAFAMMSHEQNDIVWHKTYWAGLKPQLPGITTASSIAFIGCGFGFLAEAAIADGYTAVQCVDDSNWIDAHKADPAWRWSGSAWVQDAPNAAVTIVKASLDNPANLRNLLGGRQDLVVLEGMLSSLQSPADPLYDAGLEGDELTDALDNAEGVVSAGGTILHIVSPNVRPPFHVKTAAEWKAHMVAGGWASHLVVADMHGSEVL